MASIAKLLAGALYGASTIGRAGWRTSCSGRTAKWRCARGTAAYGAGAWGWDGGRSILNTCNSSYAQILIRWQTRARSAVRLGIATNRTVHSARLALRGVRGVAHGEVFDVAARRCVRVQRQTRRAERASFLLPSAALRDDGMVDIGRIGRMCEPRFEAAAAAIILFEAACLRGLRLITVANKREGVLYVRRRKRSGSAERNSGEDAYHAALFAEVF